MTDTAPQQPSKKQRRIERLIRLANRAKDNSAYEIANLVFAILISHYFRYLRKHGLLLLESSRPQPMVIPDELRQWFEDACKAHRQCDNYPYLDYAKRRLHSLESKEVWGLVQRRGGSNLATIVSPLAGQHLCIPTPRLRPHVRGAVYLAGIQVVRHTSTRIRQPPDPAVIKALYDTLCKIVPEKHLVRAAKKVLKT